MAPDIQSTEDYSAATSLSAAQLMSLVRGLQPVDGLGFVIFGIIAPSTIYPDVANNERYKKYLYCDLTNNKLYRYDVAEATDWKEIGSIAVSSASQITNLVITLNKLNQDGAVLNQVIAWNGTNWAKANTVDTIANGAIAVAKLDTSGAEGSTLQTVGGTKVWTTIANLATAVLANISSFDIAKLSGKVNKGMLVTDAAGTSSWQTWADFFNTFIDNAIIKFTKLQNGTTSGDFLKWNGSAWVSTTDIITAGANLAFPTALGVTVYEITTLAAIPRYVEWVVVCTDAAGEAGYSQNDEVPLWALNSNTSDRKLLIPVNYMSAGVAILGIVRFDNAGTQYINNKAGGITAITASKWALKCYYHA